MSTSTMATLLDEAAAATFWLALAAAAGALLTELWPRRAKSGILSAFMQPEDIADVADVKLRPSAPKWKRVLLPTLAIAVFAVLGWSHEGHWRHLFTSSSSQRPWLELLASDLPWFILAGKAALTPPVTAPIGIIILSLTQLLQSLVEVWRLYTTRGSFALADDFWRSMLSSGFPLDGTLQVLLLFLTAAIATLAMSYPTRPFTVGDNVASLGQPSSDQQTSQEDDLTFFATLALSWVKPILAVSGSKSIAPEDVWLLSPFLRAKPLFLRFKRIEGATLVWRMAKANWVDALITCTLAPIYAALNLVAPYLLNRLLKALLDGTPRGRWLAFSYAAIDLVASLIQAQVSLASSSARQRSTTRSTQILRMLIHDKALRRRDMSGVLREQQQADRSEAEDMAAVKNDIDTASAGKVVNLLSHDARVVTGLPVDLYYLLQTPIQIAVACYLLYRLLGWSAFAGLATMMVVMPLQRLLLNRQIALKRVLRDKEDRRVNQVTELLGALRFFKAWGYEARFADRVIAVRETEIKWIIKARIVRIWLNLLLLIWPPMIIMSGFAAYTLLARQPLDIATAFTAIALFSLLNTPLHNLPIQIGWVLSALVSARRIDAFLQEPEVADWACELKRDHHARRSSDIGFRDASCQWHRSTKAEGELAASSEHAGFMLQDLNITFAKGQLTLIVGVVGSGKSSLLSALLGEMTCRSGEVMLDKRDGKVAYAAQVPWLEYASIRDNICFSQPYEHQRYIQVIEACGLAPDLEQFTDGDRTEIGERGITLSGGQKARVALARAIYSRAETILLDDPLSAIDASTGNHIYNKCFRGPLCAGRTILLVTHHEALCQDAATTVVRMADGRIDSITRNTSAVSSVIADEDKVQGISSELSDGEDEQPLEAPALPRKLMLDEEVAEGTVQLKVFKAYLSACGWGLVALVAGLMVARQVATYLTRLTLKWWGEHGNAECAASHATSMVVWQSSMTWQTADDDGDATSESIKWLSLYFATYVGVLLLGLAYYAILMLAEIRASRGLFIRSLQRVIRAPSRWLDQTPVGRIINRFSRDFDTVDHSAAQSLSTVFESAMSLTWTCGLLIAILPSLAWLCIGIIALYWWLSRAAISTTRDLQRLQSAARSPLFTAFGELLAGLSTVRAFAAERRYEQRFQDRLDNFCRLGWYFWMVNRWMSYRFDITAACWMTIVTVVTIYSSTSQGFTAIIIVSAMQLKDTVYWVVDLAADVQSEFNAVERVQEYCELPTELDPCSEKSPPAYWPSSESGLDIENLCVRYAPELPLVLKDINLSFKPGEKVAIVGRSGSGKSTLGCQTLLRFIEPDTGSIRLDGVDLSTISLQAVRSRGFTIIAQDTTLWAGDLRNNLDPFNDYEDAEIWDVLRRIKLVGPMTSRAASPAPVETATEAIPEVAPTRQRINSLDFAVGEGGDNLSAGQRQLVSLARALLRRPKCIVLDEATASVDFETDKLIQQVIREELASSLVITIAHRLRTVIDCDRIVVMEKGQVIEFDTPKARFAARGAFYSLCKESADVDELMEALEG